MKIECKLIFHGSCKEIDMGNFESISKAKQYVKECDWNKPYTIKRIIIKKIKNEK
jgi:hypothetical protein